MDYGCLVRVLILHPLAHRVTVMIHDSVPVSRLPELVYETKKDLAAEKLASTIVGHVGDGNFHALLIFHSDEELKRVSAAVHRLIHRAIAMDGTCKCYFIIVPHP